MARFFRYISTKVFGGERTITDSANDIGNLFSDGSEGQVFFDLVLVNFVNYDELNHAHANANFSADIDFIIQCATTSLTEPEHLQRFSMRIDAYFYIYCRLEEYIKINNGYDSELKKYREILFKELGNVFAATKGMHPNISITEPDMIRRIDIRKHLNMIKEISDKVTLNILLALCKLSFQSDLLLNGNGGPQWRDILSKISSWKISPTNFISLYIEYKQAFEPFPLDMPAFIYLTSKIHPPKEVQKSPFVTYFDFLKELNLSPKLFFEQFQSVFVDGVTKKVYKLLHVASIFQILSSSDELLFGNYLSAFSSKVSDDDLWAMFLNLSESSDINESMQKHFSLTLTQRTQKISIDKVKNYHKWCMESLKKIKNENYEKFLKILQTVIHEFLNIQLNDEKYSYQFKESNLKEFLTITLELSSTHSLQHPSCLLIIRHLLFKLDKDISNKYKKVKSLFERLNGFDQNLCETNDPAGIIQDEWLNDYIFHIFQDWQNMDKKDYDNLCNTHHDNRWSIHIWSRLITLSLLKSETGKSSEMLACLNKWMINVKHDIYNVNDTLTIIFVKNVFEFIIAKHIKSVLALANIGSIIEYILRAKQDQNYLIDIKQVDDFIQNVQHSIKDILLLNGKSNHRHCVLQFIIYQIS
jgi:hypothetical protein